jgi:hypothetical protein
MEHTGSTAVEKPIQPIVLRKAEILEGTGMEQAPALKGYIRFTAKPTAETVLSIEHKDPLLSRWQYGLGRAAVFASDAKARWAASWVGWPGYDRFWGNLLRDLLPHTAEGEATLEYDSTSGDLVADYRLSRHTDAPARLPELYAFGPEGFQRPLELSRVADGAYRARVRIGNRHGLFRVRPLEESRAFPEIGLYREEEELREFGSNPGLLRQLSSFTGGRFQPSPEAVFDAGGRSRRALMELWPMLVAAAILLNLAEVLLRKRKGILETLRRRS